MGSQCINTVDTGTDAYCMFGIGSGQFWMGISPLPPEARCSDIHFAIRRADFP